MDITLCVDALVRVSADFVLPVSPRDIDLVANMVGKTISMIGGNEIEIVKASAKDKQRCFYCAQLSDAKALECRKCGARLEE